MPSNAKCIGTGADHPGTDAPKGCVRCRGDDDIALPDAVGEAEFDVGTVTLGDLGFSGDPHVAVIMPDDVYSGITHAGDIGVGDAIVVATLSSGNTAAELASSTISYSHMSGAAASIGWSVPCAMRVNVVCDGDFARCTLASVCGDVAANAVMVVGVLNGVRVRSKSGSERAENQEAPKARRGSAGAGAGAGVVVA